jgi:hypothetical protein
METITLETTIAYPAKRRGSEGEEPRIIFTIPTHSDLFPYLAASPPKAISCYYRNLKFKYGTLTKGTPIKLTAIIEQGKRGGITLHIKELELTGPTVPDLTKVNAKMMNKWTKQFEKQYGSQGL